jgi:hypothetical protein
MGSKFLKISRNYELKILDNPDETGSDSVRYWIKCTDSGKPHQDKSKTNSYYLINNYRILDKNLKKTQIIELNFICKSIKEKYIRNDWSLVVILQDINGETRTREFSSGGILSRFKKLFNYLETYGSLKSWEAIEVQEKYDELNERYENLYIENENLKKELTKTGKK